jgi:hypothetical protein
MAVDSLDKYGIYFGTTAARYTPPPMREIAGIRLCGICGGVIGRGADPSVNQYLRLTFLL